MVRKSKGRQRVEMVKMQNENNLQVTFSKRRAGLFKKASELSTLCGVDVAIVVFSPGKKVFSFGHPSVEAVVERFLGDNNHREAVATTEQLIEAHRNARVRDLNMELTHVERMIENERKRGEKIDEVVKANQEVQGWIRKPCDELDLNQLSVMRNAMETLLKDINEKACSLMMVNGNGFPFNVHRHAMNIGGDNNNSGVRNNVPNNVFNPREASTSGGDASNLGVNANIHGIGNRFF